MVIVINLAAPLVPFLDIDFTTAEKCVSLVLYGPYQPLNEQGFSQHRFDTTNKFGKHVV